MVGLAETYGNTGQVEKGLAILTETLTLARCTGERFYEAEIHRLKGELLLKQAEVLQQAQEEVEALRQAQDEAENCFFEAVKVARRQQAKSLELRAAMSLGRLWQRQGQGARARQMLVEIYDWFSEGFDTTDLREAKRLLAALSVN